MVVVFIRKLSFLLLFLLLLLPLFLVSKAKASNSSPIYENIYLRVAPSNQDGVIDFYYKGKVGNWKKFNSLAVVAKNDRGLSNSQLDKVSFTSEQLTDGLQSRPDLTKAKFQFGTFNNGIQIYLIMEMDLGKPYVKLTAYKNASSADVNELSLSLVNGLEELVQKIQINGATYDALNCGTFSPGCSDPRTITDGSSFPLIKPDNRIIKLVGETGIKQLYFTDQDFSTTDKISLTVKTKGAKLTKSLATPSAQRKEEPWFDSLSLTRTPFNGDNNNWFVGIDTESLQTTQPPPIKEKRNLSFRVKFNGITNNAGNKQVAITVKQGTTTVLTKKVSVVGTSSGVYLGTLENLPGKVALDVYIKGPKQLTTKFTLPVGVETVDWSSEPLSGGDANNDDRVDSTDFALLQRDYLQSIVSAADFNYDVRVDSQDFAILQAGYLQPSSKP